MKLIPEMHCKYMNMTPEDGRDENGELLCFDHEEEKEHQGSGYYIPLFDSEFYSANNVNMTYNRGWPLPSVDDDGNPIYNNGEDGIKQVVAVLFQVNNVEVPEGKVIEHP